MTDRTQASTVSSGRSGKTFAAGSKAALRTTAAAIALSLAASPLAAACLDSAASTPEITAQSFSSVDRAHAMRILQSEMMVAGLSCGAKPAYNAFALKYKATLVRNGDRLKKHYYAEYGAADGFKKLNTFVTRLANEASVRIAQYGHGYCEKAMARFDRLLSAPVEALDRYSTQFAMELGMEPTTPLVVQVAATSDDGCAVTDERVASTAE
ncbi:MAG: hypothetical protein RIM72_13375 [Alphaproteobacteria bacterium]